MILHLFLIREILKSACIPSYSRIYINNEDERLDSNEQPKLIMIKFTYASSYPKTMMIILLYTSITIIAMFASVWKFFNSTYFAFSIFWNLKFSYMPKTWLFFHFFLNIILNAKGLFVSLR